jgi:DNA-binding transcriptional MerR regulator
MGPMAPPGLTISQLAAHTGVTVRAIRHYHQRGLLAEPERDGSGYRRYGAEAVADLIRIRTLAGAGVPLARIRDLLSAGPAEFAAAIGEIDQALQRQIRALTAHRRQIAQLAGGERMFLPAAVVDLLDFLRGLGASERAVRTERDGWILVSALSPELVPDWVGRKRAALADPEFCRLYLAVDEAYDWDPADPRLDDLAAWTARWSARDPAGPAPDPAEVPAAITLMSWQVASSSPAWQRLGSLAQRSGGAAGEQGGDAPGEYSGD